MTQRFLARLMVLVLVVAVLSGCTASSGNKNTLNLSMFHGPKGVFNPILFEDQYDSNIIALVYEGLLRNDENLSWVCNLCERMDVSADNRTVTFTLKNGVTWHDGKPFTTADVAFTFRAMLHPDYTGVRAPDYAPLVGVEAMLVARWDRFDKVEAGSMTVDEAASKNMADWEAWLAGDAKRAINVIDEKTISFSTDEPHAPFVENLAFAIIPEHIFKDANIADMADHEGTKKPIGTGPFVFKEYRPDQYVRLERFEKYHMGSPKIQTVMYKVVNQDVSLGQFLKGELDFIQLQPADVAEVKDQPGVLFVERMDFGYQYMGLNHDNPLFQDQKVRQALMYGINRQALVDTLLRGYGTLLNSHMPPVIWAYDGDALNHYQHDVAKAKSLLAEAGWTQTNSEGYLVKEGKVFEFVLKYPTGNKVREDSAPLIQADLKNLGIKVTLQSYEFTALSEAVFDNRDMDAWLMGWGLGIDPDPGALFLPDNKWGQVTGWRNARNEQLIREGTRITSQAERKPIYVEWAKIVNEELPYVFLYTMDNLEALRSDRIQGLTPDARGSLWNIWELSLTNP